MIKGVRGILVVACMLLAAPAVAGTVYRCTGADGSSSYSSDRIDGAKCKAVSNFKHAPDAASPTNAPKQVTGKVYSYVEGGELGRAECRKSVWQSVVNSVVHL